MQTILVILTFFFAAGFLLKKFVWNPLIEKKQKKNGSIDASNTKCRNNDCGCY